MDRKLDLSSLRTYLAFPVQDREATNRFLIGAALYVAASVVPIVPMIPALGYQYQVMRRVVEGERPGMPPWDNWGRLFMDGLRLLLIGGVFLLPGLLLFFGGMGLYFFSFIGMMSASGDPGLGMVMIWMVSLVLMLLGFSVGMLLMLLGWIPLPLATAHAVAHDDVLAAFRVRQWWPILRQVRGDYLIGWVIFFGLGGLLYTTYMLLYATIVLCMALPLVLGVLSFYMFLAGSAIFAAIYRQGAQGLPATEAAGAAPGPWAPASARPGAAPTLEPAAGEMLAVETAASTESSPPSFTGGTTTPGEEPDLAPAAGEMIAVDIAAESETGTNPPTAVIEEDLTEVFAPELPVPPADTHATTRLDRSALLAGSLPDEPETPPGPAEIFEPPADPGATYRLPPDAGDPENSR